MDVDVAPPGVELPSGSGEWLGRPPLAPPGGGAVGVLAPPGEGVAPVDLAATVGEGGASGAGEPEAVAVGVVVPVPAPAPVPAPELAPAQAPPGPYGIPGLAVFSTVAHELRGPLMALATSAELLAADFDQLAAEQVREMVAGIHCRTLWLQELVENLLCAASLREGRLALHVQPLSLAEVVADVRQVVSPLLTRRAQRLRIRETARPALPEVRADGRRLGQVLVNLILNASKFSPPGAPVEVLLARRGPAMRVTVADRGPGLPEGLVRRLFEPFFRAPSTPVLSRPGTAGGVAPAGVGLGLAIVKEIITCHGGRVGAANRRGGGARFWFELPLRPTQVLSASGLRPEPPVLGAGC